MSDSTTEFKPTLPGLRNAATDPPWMRPGRHVSTCNMFKGISLKQCDNTSPHMQKLTINFRKRYSIIREHNFGFIL